MYSNSKAVGLERENMQSLAADLDQIRISIELMLRPYSANAQAHFVEGGRTEFFTTKDLIVLKTVATLLRGDHA